ncbi:MAG: TetR/AcrR family transcriptional regulator [Schleiferiaceae bacterium]|jgi:AcrR family transcriptional regulator|nr:TetR/AcrR family transcriptional regulator [Schleiferiaceae bacterium]
MQDLLTKIEIKLNESIYIKDPNSSELGKRIVSGGVDLIAELGFEQFNFKKLGLHIASPEASIYRYFESKHKLLLYITSWYWGWMEYKLVFALANIASPEERLEIALNLLTADLNDTAEYPHINKVNLQRILTNEASKAYLCKEVDDENSHGVFLGYKQVVARISDIIHEINPDYAYPHMLISTVVEGAHHQRYFADHLPRLTDKIDDKNAIKEFYKELVLKAIQK